MRLTSYGLGVSEQERENEGGREREGVRKREFRIHALGQPTKRVAQTETGIRNACNDSSVRIAELRE